MASKFIRRWIISDTKTGKIEKIVNAHSFLPPIVEAIYIGMVQNAAYVSALKDTSNANNTIMCFGLNFDINSGAGTITKGIVVGTSSQAVALTDYQLIALISHGVGAGNLQYGAMSVLAPATVGTKRSTTISRVLTNGSGGDITVNEVGLIMVISNSGGVGKYYLVERSLLTFIVANGGNKTLTYEFGVQL